MFKPMSRTLAMVRETFNTYLANAGSVVVQSKSYTPDGMGGNAETLTAIGTLAAWIQPMAITSQIDAAGGALAEQQMYTMVCGTTVAVTLGNLVVYNGGTYEIIDMSHTTEIEWAAMQKATIVRVVG
jgi:hypothetical protein